MSMTDVQFESKSQDTDAESVTTTTIVERARELFQNNYRFITATCLDCGDHLEVLYHFDKDMKMQHVRLLVAKGQEVPSLSSVYLCAFIIENEMKELFGLNVTGLAVDYQGKLLLSEHSPKLPMLKPEPAQVQTSDAGGR
jgi:NADH:ubiquinone oxidoreductase subunit C